MSLMFRTNKYSYRIIKTKFCYNANVRLKLNDSYVLINDDELIIIIIVINSTLNKLYKT
jgi:hypothetical protein